MVRHPSFMFANLLQLIGGRPSTDFEREFVREVRVRRRHPRDPRTEKLILAGWLLIVAKSFLMIWLVDRYHVPINADWVIVPTVAFAAVCTAAYLFLRD